jgi:hypothetical protein
MWRLGRVWGLTGARRFRSVWSFTRVRRLGRVWRPGRMRRFTRMRRLGRVRRPGRMRRFTRMWRLGRVRCPGRMRRFTRMWRLGRVRCLGRDRCRRRGFAGIHNEMSTDVIGVGACVVISVSCQGSRLAEAKRAEGYDQNDQCSFYLHFVFHNRLHKPPFDSLFSLRVMWPERPNIITITARIVLRPGLQTLSPVPGKFLHPTANFRANASRNR